MGHAETFEHTADLGLRVVGRDLSDLFETAAAGLFDVIVANREAVRDDKEETVSLVGRDPPGPAARLAQRADLPLGDRPSPLQPISACRLHEDRTATSRPRSRASRSTATGMCSTTRSRRPRTTGSSSDRVDEGWLAEVILDI